jgi:diguanylate cyclase (GGDEF)-like protein
LSKNAQGFANGVEQLGVTLVGGDRARIRSLLPMIAMAVAAQLSGLVGGSLHNPLLWGLSAVLLVLSIVVLVGPGDRPSWLLLKVCPAVYLCSATLLILSQTNSPSGLSIILLIPVLAVAVSGTVRDAVITVTAMLLALSLVSIEHQLDWVVIFRTLALWGAMGATIVVTLHQFRARLRQAQGELLRQATTDVVTGLTNRRGFIESVAERRGKNRFAVLTIDVDGLKGVNDQFGHEAGDELIRGVAVACAVAARKDDIVARLGGDEFAVFAVGASCEDGRVIAERISMAVSNVMVRGRRARASIGVAAGGPSSDLEDVLSESDAAMYEDKRTAKIRAALSA